MERREGAAIVGKKMMDENADPDGFDSAIQFLAEQNALSKFDTVFLFLFSVITVSFSVLALSVGTFGGLLPIFLVFLSVYPFYLGIWEGMMNDNASARLFAWKILIVEVAFAVFLFGFFLIIAVLMNVALDNEAEIANALNISVDSAVFLVNIVGLVFLVTLGSVLMLAVRRAWRA